MTNFFELTVWGLCCWRLTRMLRREDGPGRVFYHFRVFLRLNGPNAEIPPDGSFADGFSCKRCLSIWIGFILTAILANFEFGIFLAIPFALSAIAIWIESFDEDLWPEGNKDLQEDYEEPRGY